MDFPYGARQPTMIIAKDLLAAMTPPGMIGLMRRDAIEVGTPIHNEFYIGHDMTVNDPPLDRFFMFMLERPLHFETEELPRGKIWLYLIDLKTNVCLVGSYLATCYLRISDLFDSKAASTLFHVQTKYVKIEDGYDNGMVNMDYAFMERVKRIFDSKIKLKFPEKKSLLACNHSKVR